MELTRRKFQGVLNILSFNRHFYVIGLGALTIIIMTFSYFNLSQVLLWIVVFSFIYGLLTPLIVSAYVYDFSGYYNFNWLNKFKKENTGRLELVNINAGFDETSYILKNIFPNSDLQVLDFYNSDRHTEPAIVRARKVSLTFPNTLQIDTNRLPIERNSADMVFLLSAAHEIRNHNEKVEFFKECRRICKSDGRIIMVEHLRDVPNFLAFTVGFTHFFSKNTWKKALKSAGFKNIEEKKFTPFMSIFTCNP